MGNLYTFSRDIKDKEGQRYAQWASVFADDVKQAKEMLDFIIDTMEQLESNDSQDDDFPFKDHPAWKIDEFPLDEPTLIRMDIERQREEV